MQDTTLNLICIQSRLHEVLFTFFFFFIINRDLYYHYITYNTFTSKFKVTKNYN